MHIVDSFAIQETMSKKHILLRPKKVNIYVPAFIIVLNIIGLCGVYKLTLTSTHVTAAKQL